MKPGLGTRLRRLLELLDGDLEIVYRDLGFSDYVPRYTPIVRALAALGPSTIRTISQHAQVSHSAVSQTVARMRKAGLVASEVGDDARERRVSMTRKLSRRLPRLRRQWAATESAALALDAELSRSLGEIVDEAIVVLTATPFRERVRQHIDRLEHDDTGST